MREIEGNKQVALVLVSRASPLPSAAPIAFSIGTRAAEGSGLARETTLVPGHNQRPKLRQQRLSSRDSESSYTLTWQSFVPVAIEMLLQEVACTLMARGHCPFHAVTKGNHTNVAHFAEGGQ